MGSSQPSRDDRGQKDIYKDSRSPPSRGIQPTRKGLICGTQLGRQEWLLKKTINSKACEAILKVRERHTQTEEERRAEPIATVEPGH